MISSQFTLVMGKVGCLVIWLALPVGFLGGPVLIFNMAGVVKKIWVTPGFGFQVILVGSLGVPGTYTLNLSCGIFSTS